MGRNALICNFIYSNVWYFRESFLLVVFFRSLYKIRCLAGSAWNIILANFKLFQVLKPISCNNYVELEKAAALIWGEYICRAQTTLRKKREPDDEFFFNGWRMQIEREKKTSERQTTYMVLSRMRKKSRNCGHCSTRCDFFLMKWIKKRSHFFLMRWNSGDFEDISIWTKNDGLNK